MCSYKDLTIRPHANIQIIRSVIVRKSESILRLGLRSKNFIIPEAQVHVKRYQENLSIHRLLEIQQVWGGAEICISTSPQVMFTLMTLF